MFVHTYSCKNASSTGADTLYQASAGPSTAQLNEEKQTGRKGHPCHTPIRCNTPVAGSETRLQPSKTPGQTPRTLSSPGSRSSARRPRSQTPVEVPVEAPVEAAVEAAVSRGGSQRGVPHKGAPGPRHTAVRALFASDPPPPRPTSVIQSDTFYTRFMKAFGRQKLKYRRADNARGPGMRRRGSPRRSDKERGDAGGGPRNGSIRARAEKGRRAQKRRTTAPDADCVSVGPVHGVAAHSTRTWARPSSGFTQPIAAAKR